MAILFIDNAGGVFRTDLGSGQTVKLADYAQFWTDIAVTPDGRIFANTFSELYELDLDAGSATAVAFLDGGANGLASDADGNLYVGSFSTNEISVLNGTNFSEIDRISLPDSTRSSGDIHITGDTLYYSSARADVLTYDLASDTLVSTVNHGIFALYGLQLEGGTLYGLASNNVYELDPITGDNTQIFDLPISGSVNGAATLAGVTIEGTNRADVIQADIGGSTIYGLAGRDILIGDEASDALFGGKGRDYLFGNEGRDRLDGGKGRDTLDGGKGNDRLKGGSGQDQFVFEKRDGRDVVLDFHDDIDQIEISAAMMGRGAKTVERLLEDFASQNGDDLILDFGRRGEIEIRDTTVTEIADDILIF
ncbi:MAG: hypothetical protein AB3N11_08795 [Arenibacterium sp.]